MDWDQWSKARLRWRLTARPDQLTPPGDWQCWFLLGGRGCLAPGSRVWDPVANRPVAIEDRHNPGPVLALGSEGPVIAQASASYLKGEAQLWRVRTATGDEVTATDQHRFLTPRGWVHLVDIAVGDEIACASRSAWLEGARHWSGTGYALGGTDGTLQLGRSVEGAWVDHSRWHKVTAITKAGYGDYYDLTVPGYENYLAEGMWHHNSGKSRSGSEDISEWCRTHPNTRIALVPPTFADGRDTMVEGESGILAVLPPSALRGGTKESAWNRSIGELHLSNGCYLRVLAAETPDRLRGPQWHRALCDEPASWSDAHKGDALDTTWSNLMLSLRLGANPQVVVTGTPRPLALIRHLMSSPTTILTKSRTFDNLAHLAPTFAAQVMERYAGTRLGRQELDAELLEDTEGALWTPQMLENRCDEAPPMSRVVIGVDPAGSDKGAETGIVAAGLGVDKRYYVLGDYSVRGSPAQWAASVAHAYDVSGADRVVAERNYGGDMVAATLATERSTLPVRMVTATRGKAVRAEPVAALYEQGRVSHVGDLARLEEQMLSWVPGAPGPSPDLIDACVWAISDLMAHGPRTVAMAPPARIAHRILN